MLLLQIKSEVENEDDFPQSDAESSPIQANDLDHAYHSGDKPCVIAIESSNKGTFQQLHNA